MKIFWHMTAGGTLLILAVLLFRAAAFRRVPKRFFILMWCIVMARLLIPYSIPVSLNPGGVGQLISEQIERTGGKVTRLSETTLLPAQTDPDSDGQVPTKGAEQKILFPKLGQLLFVIWSGVAASIAVFIFTSHIRWLKRYRASLPLDDGTDLNDTVETWLDARDSFRKIRVRQSDEIHSPLTYGVFRPVILLPSEITWKTKKELILVLEHEWVHIRHFDICTKYVMCLVLCVYWFHPLVWVMYGLLDRDMELSCDEEVLSAAHSTSRTDYACLLLKLAERQNCDILGTGFSKYSAMKERIELIMKRDKYTMWACGLAAAIILCMTAAFIIPKKTASPEQAKHSGTDFEQTDAASSPPITAEDADNTSMLITKEQTASAFTGEEIAKLAEKYVGNPYQYGGDDLETGVDCSGFVKEIYKQAGITLPRELAGLKDEGTPVTDGELRAGDLIFYGITDRNTSETPDHVALYLGDQKVIHASNAKDGIKISDLNYRSPFAATRIVNQ